MGSQLRTLRQVSNDELSRKALSLDSGDLVAGDDGRIISAKVTSNGLAGVDSTTELNLSFNGVDAATTYETDDFFERTVLFQNSAQLDTAQKKIGSASLLLDGATTDFVKVNGVITFTNAFTIEMFIRIASGKSGQNMHLYDCDGIELRYDGTDGKLKLDVNAADGDYEATFSLGDTTFFHIEANMASNGTCLMFLDGVSKAVTANATYSGGTISNANLRIGADVSEVATFEGHIDVLRASNDVKHTSGFTPTTVEYGINKLTKEYVPLTDIQLLYDRTNSGFLIGLNSLTSGSVLSAKKGTGTLDVVDSALEIHQALDVATAGASFRGFSNGGAARTEVSGISLFQTVGGSDGGYISLNVHDGTSANQEVMRVAQIKNIGIGKTAVANAKLDVDGAVVVKSFTVATLPAQVTGGIIFVSDETGGAVLAFSDGTNYRRVTDRAIVA